MAIFNSYAKLVQITGGYLPLSLGGPYSIPVSLDGQHQVKPNIVDGKQLGPFKKDSLDPNHHFVDMGPPMGSPVWLLNVDNINPNLNGNL